MLGHGLGRLLHGLFDGPPQNDTRQLLIRGIVHLLPHSQFAAGEARKIVLGRHLDRHLTRRRRLHQHSPPFNAPPRPAGHLGNQMEGPLAGPKLGLMQQRVGINHSHQGHIRKIEPLGDHLRAEQNADLARSKALQCPVVAPRTLHRIAVHPQAGVIAEPGFDLGLQPLRPGPQTSHARMSAVRAMCDELRAVVT